MCVPPDDKIETVRKLISGLKSDLHGARAAADSIPLIEDQLACAELLLAKLASKNLAPTKPAGGAVPLNQAGYSTDEELSPINGTDNGNGDSPAAKLIRAKNMGDLTYQMLRANPGITALQLHFKMQKSGASVGSSEYLYTLLKKLEEHGFARHGKNERGTKIYFAVERDDEAKIRVHSKTGIQMTQ